MILAAVLLKLGTYGFVRIAIPILPEAAVEWAPWIGLLAVIGIIYGALGCLAQTDFKRLIAFSSVAHMGFVMLGIATCGNIGSEKRISPYVPIFSSTPARITEPAVGASTCASGSQVWNGNIGTLMAKAMKNAKNSQIAAVIP